MTNSNNLSTQPSPRSSLTWVALLLAIVGFGDALYLTVSHYQNKIPPCSIGGCETVLTSQYATVAGIPISLIGVLYYLAIAICLIALVDQGSSKWLRTWRVLSGSGFAVTLVLIGLQLFVLHAICLYCMVSATITILLFILSRMVKPVTQ